MAAAKTTGTNSMKIAVVPGDGIGNEVVPEGIRVLEAVGSAVRPRLHLGHLRLVLPALRQDAAP